MNNPQAVIEVTAHDVQGRIEGGNLGCTQLGRIEYALAGGRCYTDAIDNSAGVDTSDHEVNIKIATGEAITRGALKREDRDPLLFSMTDEVAALVLRHNYQQSQAISVAAERRAGLLVFGPDRAQISPRAFRRATRAVLEGAPCLVWLPGA